MRVMQVSAWRRELASVACMHKHKSRPKAEGPKGPLPTYPRRGCCLVPDPELCVGFAPVASFSLNPPWSSGPRVSGSVLPCLIFCGMLLGVTRPSRLSPRSGGKKTLSYLSKACPSLTSQRYCTLTQACVILTLIISGSPSLNLPFLSTALSR